MIQLARVASRIRLNDDKLSDFVVQQECGGSYSRFWVFVESDQDWSKYYDLVFQSDTKFLTVLNTSTRGYRDLQTVVFSGIDSSTTTYKYIGDSYQPKTCSVFNFKSKRTKCVPCSSFGF